MKAKKVGTGRQGQNFSNQGSWSHEVTYIDFILGDSNILKPFLNCFCSHNNLFKFIFKFLKLKIYNDNFYIKDLVS